MIADHYAGASRRWAEGAALVYGPIARQLIVRSPHPLAGRAAPYDQSLPRIAVKQRPTYRQSLQYLRIVGDGVIPPSEAGRILGENVLRLLKAA